MDPNRKYWNKVDCRETGNAMTPAEITALSAALDIEALRAYRLAVGRRTRQVVCGLQAPALNQKVE